MTTASQGRMEWRVVPLSQVCAFKPAKSICRKQLADDAEVSFVPMNDLGELVKYFEPQDVRVFGEVVKSYTYFADGDVLCAKITPCFENGKLGVARNLRNGIGFGSSEFVVMRASGEILPEYLYYFLSRDSFREAGARVMSGAVGHKRVPNEYFENLLVPLPPLKEQKRIVAVLDQAFAALDRARAHAEANLADVRELFDDTLSGTFSLPHKGWVEAAIGDCIRFIDYRGRTPEKTTSGLRLITAKNVKKGYLQDEPREFVAEDSYSGWMTRGIPVTGDVLFTTEAPLGNVAQLDTSEKVVFAQRVIIMQPDINRIDRTFLKYMLLSSPVQKRVHANATGATALGIKASLLKTIKIAFPETLAEQRGIVEKLDLLQDEAKRLESHYTRKLADLATLRQSLLQKAFAGELT